ncbi:MAG: anthranilate phosphoribosyltransferase, partial [SAR202 cluster bacterium]|nr:anthranilate phosphoribosyltransferase [SAR202 cluster bacterium]
MNIFDLINKVYSRENLSYEESQYCMREIMSGNILPSQFGALMSALAMKEETSTELAGMASIMREYSLKI